MGQYYKAICLDTKQCYTPDGVKLMEHSYICNRDVMVVSQLLYGNNEWAGKRLVWAGDYGEGKFESEFPDPIRYREDDNYERPLYAIASNWFEELGPKFDYCNYSSFEEYKLNLETFYQNALNHGAQDICYYVNEDRKEYVDLAHAKPGYRADIYVHPLPILCSYGCGEGGGDYFISETHRSFPYIGLWAGGRIRSYKAGEEDCLIGYTLIDPGFTEADEDEV